MEKDWRLERYGCVESTNSLAKLKALSGEKSGLVIMASQQTAGRGRMGRSFNSPAHNGLYMSIMLRPELSVDELLQVTAMTAAETAAVIEDVTGKRTQIKWVNDILMNGKKVCGILTECGFDASRLSYIVIGIGININSAPAGIPEAGCIGDGKTEIDTLDMGVRIAQNVIDGVKVLKKGYYLPAYRSRSCLLGKDVYVIKRYGKREARVTGITDKAFLLVKYPDGTSEALSSFEVTVRNAN